MVNNYQKIQKILSNVTDNSRRSIDSLIEKKKILVNGKYATINTEIHANDNIRINDISIRISKEDLYYKTTRILLYNKKIGEICTNKDPQKRKLIFPKLPKLGILSKWIMIGRLDINTSGLLLFTNNGDLANKLMHPSYNNARQYLVKIFGKLNRKKIYSLKKGFFLENTFCSFHDIKMKSNSKWGYVTLYEGKNRQIRKMFNAVKIHVCKLKRISFGTIHLPSNLLPGKYIELSKSRTRYLLNNN